jgi:hypothetical protein
MPGCVLRTSTGDQQRPISNERCQPGSISKPRAGKLRFEIRVEIRTLIQTFELALVDARGSAGRHKAGTPQQQSLCESRRGGRQMARLQLAHVDSNPLYSVPPA